jgi:general secretion pathway protein C
MQKILYLNIVLTILFCTILAKVATDILSYRLSHSFPVTEKKNAPLPALDAPEDLVSFSAILEKGLFGSATRGVLSSIATNASPQNAASPGDLMLLGTVTGSYRETFALVQKSSTLEEKVFRLGEKVFELGRLVSVQKESAEILVGERRIKIMAPAAAFEDSRKNKGPIPASPAGFAPQITVPGSYVVDQRALNAALDNIGQAMTDARLLPSMKDGRVEGFRVSEVKPTGVFGMVGIKNGDIIMRINDFTIDSPEKAIQSLASLKGQNRIRLDLVRDGQPATFNYEIR